MRTIGDILILGERSSEGHARAKQAKITGGNVHARELLRPITSCQIHTPRTEIIQRSIFESLRLLTPNHILWDRRDGKVSVARKARLQLHDAVRLRIGKGTQQDGIDDGKDRSVGTNAEGER